MSNESDFKELYPRATIERQKQSGPFGRTYYLVRKSRREYMYSGCGDTKAQAWADAMRKKK